MFKKILIANRGEIACRVIKTARRMGIKTVAVYSEADRDALHVEMADEAVFLGPPQAAESYLVMDKIVEACRKTGAEAVHPGYGFLSEREAFARAGGGRGRLHRTKSRRDRRDGRQDQIQEGGGQGQGFDRARLSGCDRGRQACREDRRRDRLPGHDQGVRRRRRQGHAHRAFELEVEEGFNLAKAEAKASFGDDRVFVEKFIVDPRHIEIQVLGDKHGNVIYLGERECSIQRRNQKVIEEAPSPLLDEATRRKMGEQAVALAKAVNYDSAGTVEFVAGQDKSFYFLEMNTRLQVEHPVTELITGIDLVEQMIRVAAGEKLALAQKDVTLTGWAVESRVYAEDPFRNFLPSIGGW
jgi:propionyl-CoA carboxylase alpha chain